jgi:hypothetical protein
MTLPCFPPFTAFQAAPKALYLYQERIAFAFADNKLESSSVLAYKCPAHPCAIAKKTLRKVKITPLEAVDER